MWFRPVRKRFLFVTHNKNKIKEIEAVFPTQHDLIHLHHLKFTDPIPETGETLEENALLKAAHLHELSGYDCFADDTGLEVDALDGRPGVYSARYAGEEATDAENVAKLLEELNGQENRQARFRTIIALIVNNQEHFFEGMVRGTISKTPRGNSGFGYDPVFVPEGSDKTFAEMDRTEKNRISHRGEAVGKLIRHINLMEVRRLRFWF